MMSVLKKESSSKSSSSFVISFSFSQKVLYKEKKKEIFFVFCYLNATFFQNSPFFLFFFLAKFLCE